MTPASTTPAGRKASRQHRRVRQSARPVTPRRVSGPVGGRAATAATATGARAATAPRRALPRRPRAVAVGLSLGAFIRSLPDHRLLDRLIRGRWWIPVLGVMLAGVVAMQVEVLKLGASMGRSLERNSLLSSRNAALRQSVATLGDDQRIEQLAGSMGMVMPPPQAVGFLTASADGNPGRAVANIHAPSSSSFLSLTPTNGEIVTADLLAAATAPAGTTGSTSTIGSTPTSTSSTSSATTAASSAATAASASGEAATPIAVEPTGPSSAASTSAATPTPVTPAPTSSSTTSSSPATSQPQAVVPATGSSTGAVGVAPPTTSSGGG